MYIMSSRAHPMPACSQVMVSFLSEGEPFSLKVSHP